MLWKHRGQSKGMPNCQVLSALPSCYVYRLYSLHAVQYQSVRSLKTACIAANLPFDADMQNMHSHQPMDHMFLHNWNIPETSGHNDMMNSNRALIGDGTGFMNPIDWLVDRLLGNGYEAGHQSQVILLGAALLHIMPGMSTSISIFGSVFW